MWRRARLRQQAPLALILVLLVIDSRAQAPVDPLPLFANDAPLSVTLAGPFTTLSRNREDREELDGTLIYVDGAGSEVKLDVEIRTRGNSRMDVCTFPPLRLDFRRGQVEGTPFAGQNRLKLVTLCKDSRAYRDYLALEYQIYRLLNLVTDVSYRVRWLEIDYIDTDDEATERRPGFLIEEDWAVAERTGMMTWEVTELAPAQLEPEQAARVSLFEFMIGNTDWSGVKGPTGERCCHNMDVIRGTDGLAILLPYDFDQSGFINAAYAAPAAGLPIRSVRQRLYRGYCAFTTAMDAAFDRFQSVRADIMTLVAAADVRPATTRRITRYIENFYELLADPEERADSILEACH